MQHFNSNNSSQDEAIISELIKRAVDDSMPDEKFKLFLLQKLGEKYYIPKKGLILNILNKIRCFFLYSPHFPALVTSLTVLFLSLGVATSYAYLNPNITRENNLYVLKKLIENVEYHFTFSPEEKIEKNLYFADRRKKELESVYQKGLIDQLTAQEIGRNLDTAYQLTAKIDDMNEKQELEKEIAASSQQIIYELNAIVQDIEKNKQKIKVKIDKPSLQNFKKEIEQINTQLEQSVPSSQTKIPSYLNNGTSLQNPPLEESLVCVDECNNDNRECFEEGYRICGNFDTDGCLEWGQTNICEEGRICQEGECRLNCTNECVSGSRICSNNGYVICGNYDLDQCNEWSEVISCPENNTCKNGACYKPKPSCVDECQENERICDTDGYKICDNYDADSCLEFGDINVCPASTSCIEGVCKRSGETVSVMPMSFEDQECENECNVDASRQCVNNAYQICGNYDADSCLEWGELNECPETTQCQEGVCRNKL